jgi:DNA recombination protein RmuC
MAFAAGLAVGLYLRRIDRTAAALKAKQEADRELSAMRQQLSSDQERARDLRVRMSECQAEIAAAHQAINGLNETAGRARAVEDHLDEMKELVKAREAEMVSLRAAVDEERANTASAEQRLAKATAELEAMRGRNEELERGASEAHVRVEEQDAELVTVRDARARLTAELASERAALETRIHGFETGIKARDAEIATVRSTADTERESRAEQGERLGKTIAELEAVSARCEQALAEAREWRVKVEERDRELATVRDERTRLTAELNAERAAAQARLRDLEFSREQVRVELQTIASRLVEEKGKAMVLQNKEGLEAALAPVREKLREFEAKVEKTYDQETRDRVALSGQLQQLQAAQERLHKDADALAKALTTDAKKQGDWGEMMLESILETAGLREGHEYDLQVSHLDESGGRKRPDAVVYLPGNRAIVVDAKCSLTAFVAATRAASEEDRDAAIKAHLLSVRAHVKALASKNYQDVLKQRTLDVVLMFVPNEAAFHAALANDMNLYRDAFQQSVVICSPTTLLAALQLINHVWRSERQNQNARAIAEEAGKLLEKLNGFVGDLDDLGTRLEQAQESYKTASKRLRTGRGNVIGKAQEIVRLGARVRPEKVENLEIASSDVAEDTPLLAEAPAN